MKTVNADKKGSNFDIDNSNGQNKGFDFRYDKNKISN